MISTRSLFPLLAVASAAAGFALGVAAERGIHGIDIAIGYTCGQLFVMNPSAEDGTCADIRQFSEKVSTIRSHRAWR